MIRKTALVTALALLSAIGAQAVTLTADSCRQMALDYSMSLRRARNSERTAELDLQVARRQRLPMIDGSLMGIYMKDQTFMEGMTMQMRGTYTAGISLTWPIYAGGQISAGIKLASAGREVARLQSRQTRDRVISDADNCYYTLLAVREKVKMLEAYSRQMQGLSEMVELSVRAELSTANDLLRIDARRSEIEYQLQKVRNGENLCRMALCNAVGLPLDSPVELADTVLTVEPPQGLSEDFSQRPELGLLQQQVAVSEAQVKMARAGYLPTVALAGGYTYYGNIRLKGTTLLPDGTPYGYTQKLSDGLPMVGLTVKIPLFHWGCEVKKVKKSKFQLENSRLELQENTRLMSIEVRQAVQNLTDGYTMVGTAELGLRQATEARESMRRKFDVGMATLTDLLDAEAQWSQARANLIEAQTQQLINRTEYLRVTGRL